MNLNIGSDWQDRMEETVFSRDFGRLCDMLLFFLRESPFPRPSFPDRRYRVETLQRLARGDKELAERMLWNHLAFNGQDGQGLTLPQRIVRTYAQLPPPLEEAKRRCKDSGVRPEAEAAFIAYKREEVLANLRSVHSLRPGYSPTSGKKCWRTCVPSIPCVPVTISPLRARIAVRWPCKEKTARSTGMSSSPLRYPKVMKPGVSSPSWSATGAGSTPAPPACGAKRSSRNRKAKKLF